MTYEVQLLFNTSVVETLHDRDIVSCTITRDLFTEYSIGNTCSANIEITITHSPKIAFNTIKAFAIDDKKYPLGTFFIDTREFNAYGDLTLVGYDAMLKSEQLFIKTEEQSGIWPRSMSQIVTQIAQQMNIEVDSRTNLNKGNAYKLEYPATNYTSRELLGYIASANGGNWVITNENKLLLIPLWSSVPRETGLLVNEHGDYLTFGNIRIKTYPY